jgi:hypothetical protein
LEPTSLCNQLSFMEPTSHLWNSSLFGTHISLKRSLLWQFGGGL